MLDSLLAVVITAFVGKFLDVVFEYIEGRCGKLRSNRAGKHFEKRR